MDAVVKVVTTEIPGEQRNLVRKGWDQNFLDDALKAETLAAAHAEERAGAAAEATAVATAAAQAAVAAALAAQRQGASEEESTAAGAAAAANQVGTSVDDVGADVRAVAELEKQWHMTQIPTKKLRRFKTKPRPGFRQGQNVGSNDADVSSEDSVESEDSDCSQDAPPPDGGRRDPPKRARTDESASSSGRSRLTLKQKLIKQCLEKGINPDGLTVVKLKEKLKQGAQRGVNSDSAPLNPADFPVTREKLLKRSSSSKGGGVVTLDELIDVAKDTVNGWVRRNHPSVRASPEQREVCALLHIDSPQDGEEWGPASFPVKRDNLIACESERDEDTGDSENDDRDESDEDDDSEKNEDISMDIEDGSSDDSVKTSLRSCRRSSRTRRRPTHLDS